MRNNLAAACFVLPLLAGCSTSYQSTGEFSQKEFATLAEDLVGEEASIEFVTGDVMDARIVRLTRNSIDLRGEDEPISRVVPLSSVHEIKVTSPASGLAKGAGIGFVVGGVTGVIMGFADGDDTRGWFRMSAGQKALVGGVMLGTVGAVVGGLVGLAGGAAGKSYYFNEETMTKGGYRGSSTHPRLLVIEVPQILEETEQSVRILFSGKEVWLPKSKIQIERGDKSIRITVPENLLLEGKSVD